MPMTKLSGTIDDGVINLTRDIRQAFKVQSGGADLNEFHLNRVMQEERLTYKGKTLDFEDVIHSSKKSIAMNIVDRLKNVWGEESDFLWGSIGNRLPIHWTGVTYFKTSAYFPKQPFLRQSRFLLEATLYLFSSLCI